MTDLATLNPDIPGFGADGQGLWEATVIIVAGWLIAQFVIYAFDLDSLMERIANGLRRALGWPERQEDL